MCELFAVSSDQPIHIRYELRAFARRGGGRFRNRDGWGIMFAQHRCETAIRGFQCKM